MENKMMVSVYCLTYNHEKYIRTALEGFISQKTNFNYEVIVHDDASTDKTALIVKEYELKYPEIIKPIYQKENQYSKGGIIPRFILPKMTGKYVAICEGDDYWCDPYKLQKQVEAMEKSKNCHFCVHRVEGFDSTTNEHIRYFPDENYTSGIISSQDFFENFTLDWHIQTSSYFFLLEDFKKYHKGDIEFLKKKIPGDTKMLYYFASLGDIIYFDEIMSKYRMRVEGSWTTTFSLQNTNEKVKRYLDTIDFVKEFNDYTNGRYNEQCTRNIRKYHYRIFLLNDDYKNMINYPEFLKTGSRKVLVYCYLGVYCPFLLKIIKKLEINKD